MNLRDLEYFTAVCELKHFGKAAKRCFVSQPTLSGQIKRLEEELGVTLFERSNRKVMLTDVGEEILVSVKRILLEVSDIKDIANSAKDPTEATFKLGAIPTVASYIFPNLLPKLKSKMPNLTLILHEKKTDDLLRDLEFGRVDAAIVAFPLKDNLFETHELFKDEFYVAAPSNHPLSKKSTVKQSELDKYKFLLLDEGHCFRDQALEFCRSHSLSEEGDFRATSLETLRNMVRAGSGITFMPDIAISKGDKGIKYLPFSSKPPKREIGLAWRKTSTKKKVFENIIKLFLIK